MARNFNGNIEDEPVEFTEASALANIISGESLKVIVGKILKLFNSTVKDTGDSMSGQLVVQPATDVVPVISKLAASGTWHGGYWQRRR